MKNRLILFATGAMLISSCSPIYYSGSTQNVPMLQEKGSVRAGVSGNDSRLGGEFAYAVGDHIGVMGSGAAYFPKDQDNGSGGNGSRIEAGALFYTPLGEKLRFETAGLLGFGNVQNYFPSTVEDNPGTTGRIRANVFSYGVQPAFGYASRFFQMAFSCKVFMLQYNSVSGSLVYDGQDQGQYLASNRDNFMLEPALTVRGGLENLKLQLQFGRSFNLTNNSFRMDDNFMTIGLLFSVK